MVFLYYINNKSEKVDPCTDIIKRSISASSSVYLDTWCFGFVVENRSWKVGKGLSSVYLDTW